MFVKGKSGNPNGRPKGSITVLGFARDRLFKPHMDNIENVYRVAIGKALDGERWAVQLILQPILARLSTYEEGAERLSNGLFVGLSEEELVNLKKKIIETIDASAKVDQ